MVMREFSRSVSYIVTGVACAVVSVCVAFADGTLLSGGVGTWTVGDFGAKCDGIASDTAAVQKAIDTAFAAGGGKVIVPAGIYSCGSLRLRSRVELHLEEDAVIEGGIRSEDYFSFPKEVCADCPEKSDKVFLYGWNETDVAITGKGTIEGRGPEFFDRTKIRYGRFWDKPEFPRPRMVQLVGCRNVRFEGVRFHNSPNWTMLIRRCENVGVDGVRVEADRRIINSDGIDFDGCRRVRVKNSYFNTGDDCLIVRAIREPGADEQVVCEDVEVSDCTLLSACQSVRIGCPSDDTIRRIRFTNVKAGGYNGIFFDYPTAYLQKRDDGFVDVRDVVFDGFTGDFRWSALQIVVGPGIKIRGVRDVTFRNFDVKSALPLRFVGNVFSKIENVRFENVVVNGERRPDGDVHPDCSNAEPLKRKKTYYDD